MTETERNQIKGALLKCAKENENKFTLTGHIVVSSLCKSAVERIAELEEENAELKEQCLILADCDTCHSPCKNENVEMKKQLVNAKAIIRKYYNYNHICGYSYEAIDKQAEQFLKEVEK